MKRIFLNMSANLVKNEQSVFVITHTKSIIHIFQLFEDLLYFSPHAWMAILYYVTIYLERVDYFEAIAPCVFVFGSNF